MQKLGSLGQEYMQLIFSHMVGRLLKPDILSEIKLLWAAVKCRVAAYVVYYLHNKVCLSLKTILFLY